MLVVTGLWPTDDVPGAGIFVKRRLEGVRATVIAPRSYLGSVWPRYLVMLWQALSVRGRYRAVEAHVLFPTGLIGLLAAWLRRIPLVVVAHGYDVRETAQLNPVYRALASLVARRAAVIVANSDDTAEYCRRLGAEPIVIPPGVDLTHFHPTPRPRSRRVLYLGGSRIDKGVEVARQCADTLAGPGLSDVRPDDVAALIAEHDVVLMPSHAEGFGLVAVEAIASGRWVVASDVGGLREIIIDGLNGTLVTDGDFAAALARVPDYEPTTVARTVERFSIGQQQERMAALYERSA